MVPTLGGVSFPLECSLFLLPGIMSDQNTTMSAQLPHLSDIYVHTYSHLKPCALLATLQTYYDIIGGCSRHQCRLLF